MAVGQSGSAAAVFNLINAILGAGIIALPYAWAKAGFVMGWILFIFTAIVTSYTLELVIWVADPLCRNGTINIVAYEELAEAILGIWGRRLVLIAQFLYAYGITVSYIVIMHNELPTAFGQLTHSDIFEDNKILVVLIASVGILLPLSFLRSVAPLAKFSFLCFCTAFVLIGIVLYERLMNYSELCPDLNNSPFAYVPAAQEDSSGSGPVDCSTDYGNMGRIQVLEFYGIFVFTKACHHTAFPIFRSLGTKAEPVRWTWIVRIAILLCSIITSGCAMVVYSTFGQGVHADFFKNYWKKSVPVSIGRLMFASVIMLGFPIQLFLSRETLQIVIANFMEAREKKKYELISTGCDVESVSDDEVINNDRRGSAMGRRGSALDRPALDETGSAAGGDIREETSALLHYGTTLLLFTSVVGIGISTDSLSTVLSLVGGFDGSIIAFLLPGLIGFHSDKVGVKPPGGKFLAGCMAVFGVVTMFVTTIFTFVKV